MAEILIQRKRRRRVWPWLLGLLVLALIPWPFMNQRELGPAARERTARRDSVPGGAAASARDTVTLADTSTRPRGQSTSGVVDQTTAAEDTTAARRMTATAAGAIAPPDTARPIADTSPGAAPATAPATAPSGGNAFDRFLAASDTKWDASTHRQYTADGLRRLADELRSLGGSQAGVATIRAYADSLRMRNARTNARPDYARAAFLAAVHELDLLQRRHRVVVDTGRLRSTAWAIKPNRPLVTQRAAVLGFFESARSALHSLSRRE